MSVETSDLIEEPMSSHDVEVEGEELSDPSSVKSQIKSRNEFNVCKKSRPLSRRDGAEST